MRLMDGINTVGASALGPIPEPPGENALEMIEQGYEKFWLQ